RPASSAATPLARPSVGRAEGWALQASGARLSATLPAGGFGEVLTGQPGRILVLHDQFVGGTASEALAPVTAARGQSSPLPVAAETASVQGLRLATPLAGATSLVKLIAPPTLQAAPPLARSATESVRPGVAACPRASARQGLPPMPAATGGGRPSVSARTATAAQAPGATSTPGAGPAATPPSARTALLPKPPLSGRASSVSSATQVARADTASEVYLLAMLPGTSSPVAGARSTRPDGKFARTPQVSVVPSALARFRNVQVLYDGKLVPLRSCPEVTKGIPVGPLREVFEQCDGVLYWFPVAKRVKAVSPDAQVDLQIGHRQAQVNGDTVQLELAPYIKRGRTMVPLSFLAATLNLTITFDSHRGQLIISRTDM
ncbi:MAG: hypothetical protein J7M26_09720, partial [Armatimonadetes bacterium]|nr:hypothetical protein [Armatimonadota bacterium]